MRVVGEKNLFFDSEYLNLYPESGSSQLYDSRLNSVRSLSKCGQ